LAVPENAMVTDVVSEKVSEPAVNPVVPTDIVKSLVAAPDLKSFPEITTDGLLAPFEIVLVVEIVGADWATMPVPTLYATVPELGPQPVRPRDARLVLNEFEGEPVEHALKTI
jgi:hypothetical protein